MDKESSYIPTYGPLYDYSPSNFFRCLSTPVIEIANEGGPRYLFREPRAPTRLAVARRRAPSPLTIYIMSVYPGPVDAC